MELPSNVPATDVACPARGSGLMVRLGSPLLRGESRLAANCPQKCVRGSLAWLRSGYPSLFESGISTSVGSSEFSDVDAKIVTAVDPPAGLIRTVTVPV